MRCRGKREKEEEEDKGKKKNRVKESVDGGETTGKRKKSREWHVEGPRIRAASVRHG